VVGEEEEVVGGGGEQGRDWRREGEMSVVQAYPFRDMIPPS
jgi:hypothetical protein